MHVGGPESALHLCRGGLAAPIVSLWSQTFQRHRLGTSHCFSGTTVPPSLNTIYHNELIFYMFKATYTYICVANFSCTRSFFSYLYSCPHSLSVQIAGSYIYICIYTYIFLRVEQTDPDIWSHCPLSPPTLRPFFSLCYPCRVTES